MQIRCFASAVALTAGVCATALGAGPERRGILASPEKPQVASASVNSAFSVKESVITKLDVRGEVGQPFEFLAPIGDQVVLVRLDPHSILAPNYELKVQKADGSYEVVPSPPSNTYQGSVEEIPGAVVGASLQETGVEARIMLPDGSSYWIEPLGERIEGAEADDYIVYRGQDALGAPGTCGVTPAMEAEALEAAQQNGQTADERGVGLSNCGQAVPCVAQLGVDCDFTYYTLRGSSVVNVQNRVTSVINLANVQYQAQTNIVHLIVTIIVRSAEPDPYQGPSIDTLLNQLSNHWQTQQTGVVRDAVQLFTAEPTGGTIGLAFLSGICSNSIGYSVVQSDCCGSLNCAADLTAHELGHQWSAPHCSCGSSTMNPSITCSLTFLNSGSPSTADGIISFRNSRTCLAASESGTTTLPFMDNFDGSTSIDAMKWTGVDAGVAVSTSGVNEPSAPNSLAINGTRSIRTATINTSTTTDMVVNFHAQAGGGLNPPEAGESLVCEYFNSSGAWVIVRTVSTAGGAQTTYSLQTVNLPPEASHSGFRLRFRNLANSTSGDVWLIDNVSITGTAAVPGPFNLTLPANGATGVSQSPFFDWDVSFAADDYRIMVDDDPAFGSPRFNEVTGGLTSLSTGGNPLLPATTYYWKVEAINMNGQTASTPAVASFTTAGSPPGAVVLLAPTNGDFYDMPTTIAFGWQPATAANSYRIQIDDNVAFSSPDVDVPGLVFTEFNVSTGSLGNGTWRWRVIASNALGMSTSPTRTFTIDIGVPPLDGDMNCDGNVDANDCGPFGTALTDPIGYANAFPGCDINNADINNDGFVNSGDRAGMCALVPGCFFCQAPVLGDMNCDGLVNDSDCAIFDLAVNNPASYNTQYPLCQIAAGDINGDMVVNAADEAGFCALVPGCVFCEVPVCPGDANGDNMVGLSDIAVVTSNWGTAGPAGDLNGDGSVGLADIAVITSNWGNTCP